MNEFLKHPNAKALVRAEDGAYDIPPTPTNGEKMQELMRLLTLVEKGDLKARLQLIERFREITGCGLPSLPNGEV